MKKIFNWIGYDGLLHMLSCAIIMFTFTPIVGMIEGALPIALVLAGAKEFFDFFIKRGNNLAQVGHDVLFDVIGILYAMVILRLFY